MPEIKSNKAYVISALVILTVIIYIIRAASLQLFENSYKLSAENNALRRVIDYPARGLIFDRNGNLLVYNKPIYEVMVIPNQTSEFDTLELCDILGAPKALILDNINKAIEYSHFKPSKIYGPIDQEKYIVLSEKMYKFKGFFIQTRFERIYPYASGAHVLGYLREVDQDIVDTSNYYQPGDIIGFGGIERTYEVYLRGQKGVHYYLVDAFSRIVDSYKDGKYDTIAVAGSDIICTIDAELQQYAELLMTNKRGSIVAIEPKTGEILALVSSPNFDPNLLTSTKLKENYGKLQLDEDKPLFNRALGSATSPPGSTFKIVDALIGLNEGVITTESTIACNGGFNIGSHIVGCHHGGAVNFYHSISGSCNTFYCEVFTRLIRNKKFDSFEDAYRHWYDQLQKFGIGRKIGIDLPGENKGVLYTADKFNEKHGKGEWGPFRIISLAIGQGEMGITTLQLANIAAIVSNKGFYFIPHLVKKIVGREHIDSVYLQKNYTDIDSSYFTPVIEGMEQVVMFGTAANIFLPNVAQCGKTGTAQNPHGDYNSVFIAFAPKQNPQIAIAVYVENGSYGSTTAAPIASLIMEKYITDSISRPFLEEFMINKNLMNRGERTDK
ncbi:MAG: penicillin-binding protein 2 [Bacteroidales bacterium]|nr:penicillin-binding protein 2 [Bacteroidales bacterium]